MKFRGFIILVGVFCLVSLVSAGGYNNDYVDDAARAAPGVLGQSFFDYLSGFVGYLPNLTYMMIFTGVGVLGILLLEYFGFHVIDWFFTILTYCLDLVFSQIGWVLQSEKNTISAAILLIVFFAVAFGFL